MRDAYVRPCRRPPSFDRVSERLHPLLQESLRKPSRPAQDERAKVLVPIAVWRDWACAHPRLEGQKITDRDTPFLDPLQQVMPDAARQFRKLNLRQSSSSRKLHG